jgi:hypothetical protein
MHISSCDKATSPKTGSIAGKVLLIDDTQGTEQTYSDLSGIVVAVYHKTIVDTSLIRINAEYPGIGCGITEFTEFDHREHSPIRITQTDTEGAYSVESLPPGYYNCVFIKENWSLRYALNITVLGGKEPSIVNGTLYPIIELSGHINDNALFKENHHYVFSETTNIMAPVILEDGALLSLQPQATINFYNSVTATGAIDMKRGWMITSSSGLYEYGADLIDSLEKANNVTFHASMPSFSHGKASWLNGGLCFKGSLTKINNIRFINNVESIVMRQSDILIEKITITDNIFTAISGISNLPMTLNKSVIIGADTAIEPLTTGSYHIFDNYFLNNGIAITSQYSYGEIRHNNFEQNKQDIKLLYDAVGISENNFYHSRILTISQYRRTSPVHANNFYVTDGYFFNIRGSNVPYSIVDNDVDATGNYWYPNNLEQFILDANDNDSYPNQPCPHFVITEPSASRPIIGAGIRN